MLQQQELSNKGAPVSGASPCPQLQPRQHDSEQVLPALLDCQASRHGTAAKITAIVSTEMSLSLFLRPYISIILLRVF